MDTTETKPARYLSCAETAKELRKALKAEFPGIKFSVRSNNYAGKADHVVVEKGDIILIDGSVARVNTTPRANGKTFNVTIVEGGSKGMKLMEDRSKFQKIIKKAK